MDLKILSGGAANGLVTALTPAFTAATGCGLTGDFGAVGGMRDRVLAGEPVDLIILTRAIVDQLSKSGHTDPETVRDVGEVVTGVAVRADREKVDVSSGPALAAALEAADAIYVPDTVKSTAGIHVAKVLSELGIEAAVADRLRLFPNGQTALAEMAAANDANPLGLTQITEILNTPGVSYCGALPEPFSLTTVYTAAVATGCGAPDAARALIDLLTAADSAATREAAGFA